MATCCGGAAQVANTGSVETFDFNHTLSGSGPRPSLGATPDPAGGLDLASLALLTGAGTNVFQFMLPFLTEVDATPDGTEATATFGALPLPSNLKIRLEARVSDLTGVVDWDWQVTPPGDL
jgi:hypothetical protein